MLRSSYRKAHLKTLVLIVAFLLFRIPTVTKATTGISQGGLNTSHSISYPVYTPNTKSSCTVEAIAYASAIVALNDARRVADEAYRRWYECEMQGGGGGNGPRGSTTAPLDTEIPPPELSVLVDATGDR